MFGINILRLVSWDFDDAQDERRKEKKKRKTEYFFFKQQTTTKQKIRFLLLDGHSELIPSKFYDRLKYQREPLTKRSKIVAITIIVNIKQAQATRVHPFNEVWVYVCVCARVCVCVRSVFRGTENTASQLGKHMCHLNVISMRCVICMESSFLPGRSLSFCLIPSPIHCDRVRAFVCATVSTTALVVARSSARIARLLAVVCSDDVFFIFFLTFRIYRSCDCVSAFGRRTSEQIIINANIIE